VDGIFFYFGFLILVLIILLLLYQSKEENESPKSRNNSPYRAREEDASPEPWLPPGGLKLKTEYGIPSETQTGIPVKSDVERRMGNYFTTHNIQWKYEPTIWGGRYGNRAMHPDFYLPDHDVYVEYWGMLNVEDTVKKKKYVDNMNWKIDEYHRQGIKLISIYEEDLVTFINTFPRRFEEVTGTKLFPEHEKDEKKLVGEREEDRKSRVGKASPYWSFQKVKKKK